MKDKKPNSSNYWVEEPLKLSCSDCGCTISAKENNSNIGECESCWDDKYNIPLIKQ